MRPPFQSSWNASIALRISRSARRSSSSFSRRTVTSA
jgi:hypothetical protein